MAELDIDKIVIVTRRTALEELVYRLNSKDQARFYLEQNGVAFGEYELADGQYRRALEAVQRALPRELKQQVLPRELLPGYQFGAHDLVVTLGPDGLVINTAKYLEAQPILALNPDPQRVDGILIPFLYGEAAAALEAVRAGRLPVQRVSMARVTLNDGQRLDGVNDLFIGPRTHGSARYELAYGGRREVQSSSGIIVSTGAGCTGWLRSIATGAWRVAQYFGGFPGEPPASETLALGWDSDALWFTVREPFTARTAQAGVVFGQLAAGEELVLTSHMPDYGVIFSDGIESDYLAFNSGTIARVAIAPRKAHLLLRAGQGTTDERG
jgi:NAD kinase